MKRSEIKDVLKQNDLSATDGFRIEGPWGHKGLDGAKSPVYIFEPGGEKKIIGEATATTGSGGLKFNIELDDEFQSIETGSFEAPMRYTFFNNATTEPFVNWTWNCLTQGIHSGRPEPIWNLPLNYAIGLFSRNELALLVLSRIHKDALEYNIHNAEYTLEWVKRVRKHAEENYDRVLRHKVGEISNYYKSDAFQAEQARVVPRYVDNRLNPRYRLLHDHDSINMFCRILGTKSSIQASRDA